jgi:hypothetical protein
MSRWTEKLENHPIHDTILWLESAASTEFDDTDEGEATERRRLHKLLGKYKNALECIDPELLPFNQIDSLNSALRHQNIANQINAYEKNGNVANLQAANDQISNQITQLAILLSLCEKENGSNPIRELEEQFDQVIDVLTRKKDALKRDFDLLTQQCNQQKDELANLEKDVENKSSELSSMTSEWQSQFSSSQESRSQEFSKWRDAFSSEKGKEVSDLIKGYESNLKEGKEKFDNSIQGMLEDGSKKHESILELYELTAGDSVGAGYIKDASDEKGLANRWRLISVAFIAAAVVWLMVAYFKSPDVTLHKNETPLENVGVIADEKNKSLPKNSDVAVRLESKSNIGKSDSFPWHLMLMTFSISGVLLWGAAYSAQQSTKHRMNERRARWFALEIKAFDPFISSLSDDQQKELKKELAERLFGQHSTSNESDAKVTDEHAFKLVTDSISTILSKLPK